MTGNDVMSNEMIERVARALAVPAMIDAALSPHLSSKSEVRDDG